jgi:transposase
MSPAHQSTPLPQGFDIPVSDWQQTPTTVQDEFLSLLKRVDALESRLNRDSSNSSRPPSTDCTAKKRERRVKPTERRKPGAKPGHPGHQQILLEPTTAVSLFPEACGCGQSGVTILTAYRTHQVIELPVIRPEVTHWRLHQGQCGGCGKLHKASLPPDQTTGYGPRLTAFVGEMSGIVSVSRSAVQDLCASVFRIPLSKGAIQKMINRVSEALVPHYEAIGRVARAVPVNHLDETSWFTQGLKHWLWVMTNPLVAYFQIHPTRSQSAFEQLIADWKGILVSDDYGVYQSWKGLRQTCLAHLIRTAKGLVEHLESGIAAFGRRIRDELQRLCHMSTERPTVGQWRAWYARFRHLISSTMGRLDKAGTFARRLDREQEALWLFLDLPGIDATNNAAERALRFGVMWRKRTRGTYSEKGNRWVERVLSFRQTCRIRGRPTFPLLVEAVRCRFKGTLPDLRWITHHEPLLACATP